MLAPTSTSQSFREDFGQYEILWSAKCGHHEEDARRTPWPRFAGWDADMKDVVSAMRRCEVQSEKLNARVIEQSRTAGYKSHESRLGTMGIAVSSAE